MRDCGPAGPSTPIISCRRISLPGCRVRTSNQVEDRSHTPLLQIGGRRGRVACASTLTKCPPPRSRGCCWLPIVFPSFRADSLKLHLPLDLVKMPSRPIARCCCGRPSHRSRCPARIRPYFRDFLCLLACVGEEPIPGHLIFRGAFPTPSDQADDESKSGWVFSLPHFITDSAVLEQMLTYLLEGNILYSTAWEDVIDRNAPSWASRNLTFHADSHASILESLRSRQPIFNGTYEFWRHQAIKLTFHSFPYPSDPL